MSHIAITGAGSGIGRAIAHRLASSGHSVSLLGRRVDALEETAAGCNGLAASFACDVRNQGSIADAFAGVAERGPIHGLVAASGIGGANKAGPGDRFDDIVSTNLGGTYYSLRAAQRILAPGPAPRHLIVLSSILGRFGVPGYTAYCASKAALLGLVRAMALETARDNVLVNAICPGWVDTEMARDGIAMMAKGMRVPYETALAQAMSAVPLGRMGTPEEIAGVVAWLMSPDAAGVTGQGIDVNGGAWMG